MSTIKLPRTSSIIVFACTLSLAILAIMLIFHEQASLWMFAISIIIAAFIADLISGIAHFTFDYVWPDKTPILGPISVEFREHHEELELDCSDKINNFSKGAYATIPILVLTTTLIAYLQATPENFFILVTLYMTCVWMMFFHQVHSYSHMKSDLSPEEFKATVAHISTLPKDEQKIEFEKVFECAKVPKIIRILQKLRIILRPEVHWLHHNSFETDFSSLNGWSDPIMNPIYRPIARYIKEKQLMREKIQ